MAEQSTPFHSTRGADGSAEALDPSQRVLLAKTESWSLFGRKDRVRVDEYIVREWGVTSSEALQLEIRTDSGQVAIVPGKAEKRIGASIMMPASLMQQLRLRNDDPVFVRVANPTPSHPGIRVV